MTNTDLDASLRNGIDGLYDGRIARLRHLSLHASLGTTHGQFCCYGQRMASVIVEYLLTGIMLDAEVTIFADAFIDLAVQLCTFSGRASQSVAKSAGEKTVQISKASRVMEALWRLEDVQKQFDPLLGHAYGKKVSDASSTRVYRVSSGQALWQELTGDADFYLKLIRLMRDYPEQHRIRFEEEWSKAVNRFEKEFLIDFSAKDGRIDWEKLLEFNSATRAAKKPAKAKPRKKK